MADNEELLDSSVEDAEEGLLSDETDSFSDLLNNDDEDDDAFDLEQLQYHDQLVVDAYNIMFVDMLGDDDSSDEEGPWGGSLPGKRPNVERDFQGTVDKLVGYYFQGEQSLYNEVHFERRFRMPRIHLTDSLRSEIEHHSLREDLVRHIWDTRND